MRPGLALALLFTLGWVPLFLMRTESMRAALPEYTRAEKASVLSCAILLALHMTLACAPLSFAFELPLWRTVIAVVVFAAGTAFWFWGRVLIGPLRVRSLPDEPPRRFQCRGAFRIVRHPLYLSYLALAAAPLVVAPRLETGITYILCVIAFIVRAMQEERRLHAQLGPAYAAYCREVKRLVPFVW